MAVQSLIFSKTESPSGINGGKGWSRSAAAEWARDHDFRADKIDETESSFRLRQFDPDECASDSFRTLTENFPVGVSAVDCRRRSGAFSPGPFRVLDAALAAVWAILPAKLDAILAFLHDHELRALTLSDAEISARIGPRRNAVANVEGNVAVVPVMGTISRRSSMLSRSSGGVSTDSLGSTLRGFVNDDSVGAVILDIDSPGGVANGVHELATEIRALRDRKPIVAVANDVAASAAYWIGSSASEFVATPSAEVGSIGVIATHMNRSGFFEREGIAPTIVSAGRRKAELNPFGPLDDEARDSLQSRVNEFYGMFVADVAAGRGVPEKTVRTGFGEGAVVTARAALEEGMIDRIETLGDVVARLAGTRSTGSRATPEIDRLRRRASLLDK